jgi:CRISPR-associated protein Cmr5
MNTVNPGLPELRSHRVARAAYERVEARRNDDRRKKYGALTHKLPGMILQNGLSQATGFLLAKGEPHHLALLGDLALVLRSVGVTQTDNPQALHQQIIGADLETTLLLTRRSLEAAGWMKRYVQGVLRIDPTGAEAGEVS